MFPREWARQARSALRYPPSTTKHARAQGGNEKRARPPPRQRPPRARFRASWPRTASASLHAHVPLRPPARAAPHLGAEAVARGRERRASRACAAGERQSQHERARATHWATQTAKHAAVLTYPRRALGVTSVGGAPTAAACCHHVGPSAANSAAVSSGRQNSMISPCSACAVGARRDRSAVRHARCAAGCLSARTTGRECLRVDRHLLDWPINASKPGGVH